MGQGAEGLRRQGGIAERSSGRDPEVVICTDPAALRARMNGTPDIFIRSRLIPLSALGS